MSAPKVFKEGDRVFRIIEVEEIDIDVIDQEIADLTELRDKVLSLTGQAPEPTPSPEPEPTQDQPAEETPAETPDAAPDETAAEKPQDTATTTLTAEQLEGLKNLGKPPISA